MSDNPEVTTPSENSEPVQSAEEKQTNKMFSQSEHDRAVAQAKAEAIAQFKDYDEMKQRLTTLAEEQKAKEEAEMTATEKLAKELEAVTQQKAQIELENAKMNIQMLKSRILSDSKYITLPKVYKDAVTGQDESEIATNADAILEQYNQDLAQAVPKVKTFGLPSAENPVATNGQPLTMGEKIAQGLQKKLNNAIRRTGGV